MEISIRQVDIIFKHKRSQTYLGKIVYKKGKLGKNYFPEI